jgi:hypothetical protein
VTVVAILLIFFPSITGTYGIYDSVRMALDFGWLGESRFWGVMLGGGRLLYAPLAAWGFAQTPFIEDLWLLRTIGIFGLGLCGWLVASHARKSGWGLPGSLAVALVVVANPGSAVYGFWSACFPYPFALAGAFLAGRLWEESRWSGRLLSLFLLQLAFAVYQPAALFFLVGPFINWFGPARTTPRPFLAIWCFMGMAVGMLLHVVVSQLGLRFMADAIPQQDRLFGGGLWDSISHVGVSVVPRLFASWGGLLPGPWALVFVLFAVAGWVFYLVQTRGSGDRILRLLALLPVGLTLFPAIVSADHYTPYRLLAPAFSAVALVMLAGFHQVSGRFRTPPQVAHLALGILTAGLAAYTLRYGIVEPRMQEHAVLSEALKKMGTASSPKGISIIRPAGTAPIDRHVAQQGEYGAYELSFGGFSEAYLSLLAARVYGWKQDGTFPLNRIHWVFYPPEVASVPVFYPVLDLRVLLQGMEVEAPAAAQGKAVDHPYLGECLFFEPSLYLSPDVGLIQQEADDWFFMPGEGWMRWVSSPGERPVQVRDVAGRVRDLAIPSGE